MPRFALKTQYKRFYTVDFYNNRYLFLGWRFLYGNLHRKEVIEHE